MDYKQARVLLVNALAGITANALRGDAAFRTSLAVTGFPGFASMPVDELVKEVINEGLLDQEPEENGPYRQAVDILTGTALDEARSRVAELEERLGWIVTFIDEHPEWWGGENAGTTENEWLRNARVALYGEDA